jgi:hypothetical protein
MYSDIELLVTSGIGTVGQGSTPPKAIVYGELVTPNPDFVSSCGQHASVKNTHSVRENSGLPIATCAAAAATSNPFPVKQTIRSQRLRDMLAAIAEWERASGTDRAWWRSHAGHLIREWRRRYPNYWEEAAA